MVERGVNTPEIGLWKGPNIVLAERTVIPPKTIVEVPVIVYPESLPLKKDWSLGTVFPLKVSVRSRFAQAGLDIDDKTGNELLSQSNGSTKPFKSNVKVISRVERPIEGLAETGLFRLYAQKKPFLTGYPLEKMAKDERIKIDGKKGDGWEWAFDEEGRSPIGIYIRINDNNRKWMPPSLKPLLVDDKVKDYRRLLDTELEDVPLGLKEDILWIGETVKVTLGGVNGILDQVTHTHLNPNSSRGFGKQINSRLIDEETDWAIRVEILSKTTWREMPNFVRMRFIKSRQ
ncbi:MAG: hypothetical protein Q8P26_02830 [Candidatus Levybacteria bacterium]|nr:hypothetical protein [Candidatus Levybacteria bacterium]